MAKIPKDLAEQLYERYAATLMNPVSFEEMFPGDDKLVEVKDVVRWTYDNGVVSPANQLNWLYHAQKKAVDPNEPYGVGFFNGLEMALFVCDRGERVPVFMVKPEVEDLQPEVDATNERALDMAKRVGELQTERMGFEKELAEVILKTKAVLSELGGVKAELAAVKESIAEDAKAKEVKKPAPKKKKGLLSGIAGE